MLSAFGLKFHHERLPLSEAARAHQLLESGRVQGKLILKPGT